MDRWMCFIVLLAVPWPLKLAVEKPSTNLSSHLSTIGKSSLLGKASPIRIICLLLYERVELEILIVLIGLGTRIAQETLLV